MSGVDLEERATDFALKLGLLRNVLRDLGVDGCLLNLAHNFAWLTAGARNHIFLATEGSLYVNGMRAIVITNTIEGHRLCNEELSGLSVELFEEPWFNAQVPAAAVELAVGSSETFLQDTDAALERPLARLRQSLTPLDVKRYRALGADCSAVVSTVARSVTRGTTEWALAAALSQGAVERGIDVVVLLVAADERLDRIRHPLPTTKPVAEKVMLVLCGRRGGLICSLTRVVCISPTLPPDLRRRHDAVTFVDATALAKTRPGTVAGEVFAAIRDAYAARGFENEWRLHHQGGGTGYKSREWKATENSAEVVAPLHAYAWNPSISGTKSEDTVLVCEDGSVEVLTQAPASWPLVHHTVDGVTYARPDILHLPGS
ncbi:hypothetical protein ACHHYP_11806 [Achlya hypogyna]|uniref:Peptidase M24 domain-containing protein n=1 Tax=Achlya hypogyna TaxID=1202772 RepID=A0A1V9YID4_ACHHY|nr:hypothetical protein ACHHYP_11806 [Achlya hypogyna]